MKLYEDDCPSLMDDSFFSQEEFYLNNFQLELDLIIEEFLTKISIPIDHTSCQHMCNESDSVSKLAFKLTQ